MILVIDNYDSFTYNLVQYLKDVEQDIKVFRNNKITIDEIISLQPEFILISPGPSTPDNAGISLAVVEKLKGKIPIFGVCLGHQAICEAFGATVSYARKLMHGKTSQIKAVENSRMFRNMESPFRVARYHSLAAIPETIPAELIVTAMSDDGEVMAVEHRDYEIYGVQFHPESVLTPDGIKIIKNILK